MSVCVDNMKLKIRAAILICGALSFCAIFLTLNQLPTLHDRTQRYPDIEHGRRNFDETENMAHIFTFRKRLNKSNYTSENISPEMGKRPLEIKTLINETNEDIKDQSDSINQENPNFEQPNQRLTKQPDLETAENLNITNEYVDKMLYTLQTSNGLKFNFEKTKYVPYKNFLKLQSKRTRRKGMGLPIYINYNGG
jgi:hypothetical protein